jgi:hypothetical protein
MLHYKAWPVAMFRRMRLAIYAFFATLQGLVGPTKPFLLHCKSEQAQQS